MKRRLGLLLFLAVASALLVVRLSLPRAALFSADSGSKYWQTLAFAEGSGRPRGFDHPAAELDPRGLNLPPYVTAVGDRLVSIYPVLFPLLAALPVAVGGDALLHLLPFFAGLLAAWLAGRMVAAIRGRPMDWRAAGLCLAATPLAFYTLAFWENSLAAAMVLAGLLVVVVGLRDAAAPAWRWLLFGLMLGLAAWIRTEAVFLAPLAVVPLIIDGPHRGLRPSIAGGVGLLGGLGSGSLIQFAAVGSWLPLHVSYHAHSAFQTQPFLESRLRAALDFLAPDWWCGVAVLLWLTALAAVGHSSDRRSRLGLALGLVAVAASLTAALVMPAARWFAGMRPSEAFPYSAPAATWVLIAALPVVLWGQDREQLRDRRRVLLAGGAGWLISAVFLAKGVRSLEWGGRYFLPSVLLLAVVMLSLSIPEGRWRRIRRFAVATAIAAALLVQALGLMLLRHGSLTHHRLAAAVLEATEAGEVVISDSYLVPLLSGRGWSERRFLYCSRRGGLRRLLAAVARSGDSEWSFITVDRLPGPRLELGQRAAGRDGSSWQRLSESVREVGSRRLTISRYRRVGQQE